MNNKLVEVKLSKSIVSRNNDKYVSYTTTNELVFIMANLIVNLNDEMIIKLMYKAMEIGDGTKPDNIINNIFNILLKITCDGLSIKCLKDLGISLPSYCHEMDDNILAVPTSTILSGVKNKHDGALGPYIKRAINKSEKALSLYNSFKSMHEAHK